MVIGNGESSFKTGCSFFNADCIEQAYSPKTWKKLAQIRFVDFKKRKNHWTPTLHTPITKKWRHPAEVSATLITS